MKPEEAKQQLNHLKREFGLDRMTVITKLLELMQRCRDGIPQEKLSAKDGVLEVLERYPEIERKILDDIVGHIEQLEAIANAETEEKTVNFNISVERLS